MGDQSTTGWCRWTNEKHLDYLNSMEASFVRSMFENNGHLPRLDRYMPDSSESTLDSKRHKIRRHSTSDIPGYRTRTEKKTRRKSHDAAPPSQDQVVPQLAFGTEN